MNHDSASRVGGYQGNKGPCYSYRRVGLSKASRGSSTSPNSEGEFIIHVRGSGMGKCEVCLPAPTHYFILYYVFMG